MKFETKYSFDDLAIVPKWSGVLSRSDCKTEWKLGPYIFTNPIIPANMDTISGFKMMRKTAELGGLGIHHRYATVEQYNDAACHWKRVNHEEDSHYPFAVSVGSIHTSGEIERINWAIQPGNAQIICLDIAHGDSVHGGETVSYIRKLNSTIPIIAGNVCTAGAVRYLRDLGANMIKVGIAAGGVCTTAIKTGCYYPQMSAILECAEAGPIIADGGIRHAGDVAKALGAGAQAVMCGSIFAGTDCVPGWDEAMQKLEEIFKKYPTGADRSFHLGPDFILPKAKISFRGMASKEARRDTGHEGSNAEGISREVTCKEAGSTESIFNYLLEGTRSAMSYSGAFTLDQFRKTVDFIQITKAGLDQAHPHFKDH